MLNTSFAWRENQQKQLRSESDIRITLYDKDIRSSNLLGVLTKKNFKNFSITEKSAVDNSELPISTFNLSIFMITTNLYDLNEKDTLAVVEYGYNINGTWEWVFKGYFCVKSKEIPANGLIANYTFTRALTSYVGGSADDHFLSSEQRYDKGSYYGDGSRLSTSGFLLYGINTVNYDYSSFSGAGLGGTLGFVSYLEAMRQIAVVVGEVVKYEPSPYTGQGFSSYFKLIPLTNLQMTPAIISKLNCLEKPTKDAKTKYGKITFTINEDSNGSSYETFDYTSEELANLVVESGKYCKYAGIEYTDVSQASYFEFNRATVPYSGRTQFNFFPIKHTSACKTLDLNNGLEEVLAVNTCLMTKSNIDDAKRTQIFAIENNEFYSVKCRIDPAIEPMDIVKMEIESGVFVYGIVEEINCQYNGAFKGSIKIRKINTKKISATLKNISNETGTLSVSLTGTYQSNIEYRIDDGSWTALTTTNVSVPSGSVVSLRGTNPSGLNTSSVYRIIGFDKDCEIDGNIMSLIDPTLETTEVPNDYCFYKIFSNITNLKYVGADFLSADVLKDYCYNELFYDANITHNIPNTITLNIPAQIIKTGALTKVLGKTSQDVIVNLPNVREIKANSLDVAVSSSPVNWTFNLSDKHYISVSNGYYGTPIYGSTINVYYPVQLNTNTRNLVKQATSSANTHTVNVYCDRREVIENCVYYRNAYTTVNVYHLDGSEWQVPTPTISVSGDIMTISTVIYATNFDIYDGDTLHTTVSTTSVNLMNIGLSLGAHTIKVVAKSYNFIDSAFSNTISYTVLPTVETPTISITINTMTISGSPSATSYDVYVDGSVATNISTTTYDLRNAVSTSGWHTIKVVGKASGYRDSAFSNQVSYRIKLDTPTITISGNTLTITAVSNATSYDIYYDNALLTNTSSTSVNLYSLISNAGAYSIKVLAKASGYFNSDFSSTETYNRPLTTPTISITDDTLTITPVSGATAYKIYRVISIIPAQYEYMTTISTTTVDLYNYIGAGTGFAFISVVATSNEYLDSAYSSAQTYYKRLPAPTISTDSEDNLIITAVSGATNGYDLYVDGTLKTSLGQNELKTNLAWLYLDFGSHNIAVRTAPTSVNRESVDSNRVTWTQDYLTLTNYESSDATLVAETTDPSASINLEAKVGNGSWTSYTVTSSSPQTFTIPANTAIRFRGTNSNGLSNSSYQFHFRLTGKINVSGTVMSLINPTTNLDTIPNAHCFTSLFVLTSSGSLSPTGTIHSYSPNLFSARVLKGYDYSNFALGANAYSAMSAPTRINATTIKGYSFGSAFLPFLSYNLYLEKATTIESSAIVGTGIVSTVRVTKNLTSLSSGWANTIFLMNRGITAYFEFTDSDTVSFDTSNIVTQGTASNRKSTYNIYTDNTTIKDACVNKRNSYTTVHVYHLDGTDWDI